jgi:uncharacterized protein (DUF2141 family)
MQVKRFLSNLKVGNYALTALHDMSNDGKLHVGIMGIPKDGFGFSNNPAI